jgi:exosortase
MGKKKLFLLLLLLGCLAFLYKDVIAKLVSDWSTDDNYSHGFLIVPLALYFAWERRGRFISAPIRPGMTGLIFIAGGLCALFAGLLGSELFLTRISLLATLTGALWFLYGAAHVRIMFFPLAFMLLMIPIPAVIFNQIAFPLQLLASRFGEVVLSALSIPVIREGNVIRLANTTLEVAEACSGIRSLISLLTLGIVYGYFLDARLSIRFLLAAATIPIAILANGIRVAGTGIAAHYYGSETAEGFFHMFAGWLVFLAAFIMLFVFHRAIALLWPSRPVSQPAVSEPLRKETP